MPRNKDHKLRNIKRMDYSYKNRTPSFGWWVRFKRKDEKRNHFFSDAVFGSKEKALEAAIIYRDAIEKELKIGKISPGVGGLQSKSGIIGVNRTKSTSRKSYGTYTYYVWQAQWINEFGKREGKKFQVSKYGEEEALRLAIEAREKGMAYTKKYQDPLFAPPQNESIKIWRYMDFTKFVSILENKGLFFPSADILGDPFEGSLSIINQKYRSIINKHTKHFSDDIPVGDLLRKLRKWVCISCWHMNDYESAGMWNLYAKTAEAICIQSTFRKLRSGLPDTIKTGLVQYVDYHSEWIPEGNVLAPFMYKRKSFEHERELRAVSNLAGINETDLLLSNLDDNPQRSGQWIKMDMSELVERVYVAPYAPSWFEELMQGVIKTYNLDVPVIKSSIDAEPIF